MINYTHINVLGTRILSTLLIVTFSAFTFAGIRMFTDASAIDGDHMQDAEGTNTSVTNQVIRKGWGFVPGNGKFAIEDTPIDYGITFDELPFLIVKFANSKQVADGDPVDLSDCSITRNVIAAGVNQTTDGFRPILRTPTGLGFPAVTNYCYTWIAIGRHDASYNGETDPIFSDWDKSTGISIIESQISDLSHTSDADIAAMGYIKSYTETDPVFGTWDKSSGISITESQISDLAHTTDTDIEAMGYIKSYTETDPTVNSLAQTTLDCTDGQLAQYSVQSGWDCVTLTETDPVWTAASSNYYTKTNMQTDGEAQLHWNNLTDKPYGLDDGDDNVPTGSMILKMEAAPPPGYTYTGHYVLPDNGNGDAWATKSSMPTARYGVAAATVNNKIYAIGGLGASVLNTNEEYDPATDSWTAMGSMPTARYILAATAVNDKIYAIGGYAGGSNHLNTNEEYDPATNSWAAKSNMPTARYLPATVAVNDKIYAIGGNDGSNPLNTNEEYNPDTNSWATRNSMPTVRSGPAAAIVNNKIYVIGGSSNTAYLKTTVEYDPTTDSWTSRSNMSTARDKLAAEAINNKIYAIGGYNGSSLSTNEEYDPATDSWATRSSMSTARYGLAIASANNKIYAIGGNSAPSTPKNTNEEYTPLSFYHIHVKD